MNISSIINVICPAEKTVANENAEVRELCFDSRQLHNPADALFFAFKTNKNDGHNYIESLIHIGVRNFIVTENLVKYAAFAQCNFLRVADARLALQQVARFHRAQFHYPVIGVTGSNGKTIVKEWLAAMLEDEYHVVKSPDSYNSQIGVPLSVWQMSSLDNLAVFEAGISKPGEMECLSDIIQPTIGILTNIGMAHAQFFEDERQKIVEKLKLFRHSQKIIYHNNNALVNEILEKPEYGYLQKISWGDVTASYPITHREIRGRHTLLSIAGFQFEVPFLDAASLENATHVIVAMLELGCLPSTVNERLAKLTNISMRMEIQEGIQHSVLINDTYSLDFNSLNIALDFLDTQTQLNDKTLIISDFEQIGELRDEDYEHLNDRLSKHGINKLIAVGPQWLNHRSQFTCPTSHFYQNTEALLEDMPNLEFNYEAILIKGARNYHFENVVNRLMSKTHRTILNVSLPALVYNFNLYKSYLKPETKMVAMVKAHSYGLGDAELVNELVHQNVDYLAVAYTDEGVRLRKRHIQKPIIVLGAEPHSFDAMVKSKLEPEIFNFYYLHELEAVLKQNPQIQSFGIHIKVDTGMHRLGFDFPDIPKLIEVVKANPQLRIASIFSHLAAADDPAEDEFTRHQISLFKQMTDQICAAFDYPILRHILNSAGIIRFPEAQFDMVRLGIGLYGAAELPELQSQLHNVATLKTVITQVKTVPAQETIGYNRSYHLDGATQVAIIPIGYADGLPREFCNRQGFVLVQGQKVPIIGKVCMDMCMLDVSGLKVHEGDEVIVYGEGHTVVDAAKPVGLISYELLTRISKRVPRVYVKE